jgi:uncharacterized membrane protein
MFSIGLIAFGVENLIFNDFIVGRPPAWPGTSSYKTAWAILSGAILIITGVFCLYGNKYVKQGLLVSSFTILCWSVFRHIPILIDNFKWGAEIVSFGKAITIFSGTLALVAYLQKKDKQNDSSIFNNTNTFLLFSRYCLGSFMIVSGIEHFIFSDFVKYLVPRWIPGDLFWTNFSGVALIAGGLGLFIPATARLSGQLSGMMIFFWLILLHIPRAIEINSSSEWIAVVEALSISGIAFILSEDTRHHQRKLTTDSY